MFKYCCIGFIDFIFKGESWLEYTNLFSPNEYKKNGKIILKQVKLYCNACNEYRK